MKELALQMYWLHSVKHGTRLSLTDGRVALIEQPGTFNEDAGPDFSNARLRIDGTLWAGDIEMHLKASDWYHHGHDRDKAYGSVVLHVVCHDDTSVSRPDGSLLPQATMSVPRHFVDSVEILSAAGKPYLRCMLTPDFLPGLDPVQVRNWLDRMLEERYRRKAAEVLWLHERLKGDWRQTAFAVLARALGFGINAEPMEILATSIPLNFLERHSGSLFQLEALLFGMAGMLPGGDHVTDLYYQSLVREFSFLRHKYSLYPAEQTMWKLARTRPANFPYRRIALLAAYCLHGFTLLGDMLECADDTYVLQQLFRRETSPFWQTHYSFYEDKSHRPQSLTATSREMLCLNTAVPLLYAYGMHQGRPELYAKAAHILNTLRPEKIALMSKWQKGGIPVNNAADTQALLHLYKQYCLRNLCLKCQWGSELADTLLRDPLLAREHTAAYRALKGEKNNTEKKSEPDVNQSLFDCVE